MAGERIVLVEDDERIGSTLLRALEGSGYDARWTTLGAESIELATSFRPDLVLLDLGLPDIDGLDACRAIHEIDPGIVVVMLTARDEELDVVVGLDAGAVDYVSKPFKLAELLARVRAQLRRAPSPSIDPTGDVTIDVASRRVWIAENEVTMRPKEFDLLARLVADAGRVVSRETLMADVWDEHWFGSTKTLDFHVAALRRRIVEHGSSARITTLRGVGFRFEAS